MTDALKDEFPDPETELAFLEFLATEWPNWRHHVGSDYWHIRRRSFLAGRPAPQALAATPAVGYFSGCQLRGPGECQSRGMCQSMSCKHAGKVIVKRVCVEPREAGIVYPSTERAK